MYDLADLKWLLTVWIRRVVVRTRFWLAGLPYRVRTWLRQLADLRRSGQLELPRMSVQTRLWMWEFPHRVAALFSRPPGKPRRRHIHFPIASPALNIVVVVCGALVVWAVNTFPPPDQVYPLKATLSPRVDRQLILHDDAGKIFARRGGCVDAPVRLEELPKHLIDAVLAMEDRRFYYHLGIDPKGILRAAINNYQAKRIVEGGSTITQQLAKVTYLTSEKTYERKLKEALIVLRLEALLSKDEILERYLSVAYFGEGCHGVRAAARHYFKKPVGELTLSESAFMVALLRAPSKLARRRDMAWQRHGLVLKAMVEDGRLDEDLIQGLQRAETVDRSGTLGAYYADWVAQNVDATVDGESTPLKVRTTFNPKLQRIAEKAVERILKRSAKGRRASQVALVAMRTDGRVVAMVGGRNYTDSQFNRAVQALRQPGSSFKTFVYLAAMRAGAHPEMYASDSPITIGDWSPENYGRNYRGAVSLRRAFASSINTVAVRVSESVGRNRVITAARDLGISTPLTPTPSLALGASEVTLLELTAAYAAIAANAYPVRPWGVAALGEDTRKGRPPAGSGKWRLLVGPIMRDLLATTVSSGTGQAARLPIRAYGKTGTSQEFRDAWFMGFAGNLVVGVWVGNDDNSPMRRVTGGSLPAQIWQRFMSDARRQDPQFRRQLPRVTAFQSKVRRDRIETHLASNDLLDQGYGITDFFAFMTPRSQRRMREYGWERRPGWTRRERPYQRRNRRRRRNWGW